MRLLRFAACVVVILLVGAVAQAAPSINNASPGAVRPGVATDVTLTGGDLGGATTLWTSFPAKVELAPGIDKNGQDKGKITYRITLEGNVPVGIGAVRIASPKGISDLFLLMVDDLPSVADNGKNRSAKDAQTVTLPVAVDGNCDGASSDFYKFTVAAGQRISVEAVAQRLASPADPMVRLLDAAGRELIYSDDDPSTGADGRFSIICKDAGEYVVEIRDIRYASGRYRLRIGDFPLVSVPYPLGGKAGTTAKFSFAGPMVETVQPVSLTIPAGAAGSRINMSVKLAGGKSSGMATAVIGRWDEVLEIEPNDTPEAATKVTIPCALNGRLAKVKDRDFYQFDAKKGQKVVIRGVTRSLGSPSDLYMRLHAADGRKLAEVDDTNLDEGQLSFTFPADGTYRLMVEDVTRRGGAAHAYRVEIGATPTGFTLRVPAGKNATDRFISPAGGAMRIPIECVRTGYNGPITLSLQGAADGTSLYNNVIPQGGKNVALWVSLPAAAKQGDFRSLRIIGTATIDGKPVTAAVSTEALLRAKWPQMSTIPVSLSGALAVGVGPAVKPLFEISVSPKQVQFARTLAIGQFTVPLKRLNKEFKDPLQVIVEGLPAGLTYKVSKQGKGKDEHYRVDLAGPKDIAEGEHKIRIVGLGIAKGQGYRVVLADVSLRTITPLSLSVKPAGPIAPGKKQQVKLSVTTTTPEGAKPQAVTLTFKGLPAGVTGPGQITITAAAGKVELDVELSAAADAKIGKFDGLIVVAQTKYLGKDVSLESPAVQLEVKK